MKVIVIRAVFVTETTKKLTFSITELPTLDPHSNHSCNNSHNSPNLPKSLLLDALECPEQEMADISTIEPFQITNIATIPDFFVNKSERLLVRKQLLRCRKRHCKDNFQTYSVKELWNHLKESHAGDYLCQSCNHVFSGLSLIRRHYQICVVGYKCAGCSKSFNKKSNLTRHHRSCQSYLMKTKQISCPMLGNRPSLVEQSGSSALSGIPRINPTNLTLSGNFLQNKEFSLSPLPVLGNTNLRSQLESQLLQNSISNCHQPLISPLAAAMATENLQNNFQNSIKHFNFPNFLPPLQTMANPVSSDNNNKTLQNLINSVINRNTTNTSCLNLPHVESPSSTKKEEIVQSKPFMINNILDLDKSAGKKLNPINVSSGNGRSKSSSSSLTNGTKEINVIQNSEDDDDQQEENSKINVNVDDKKLMSQILKLNNIKQKNSNSNEPVKIEASNSDEEQGDVDIEIEDSTNTPRRLLSKDEVTQTDLSFSSPGNSDGNIEIELKKVHSEKVALLKKISEYESDREELIAKYNLLRAMIPSNDKS